MLQELARFTPEHASRHEHDALGGERRAWPRCPIEINAAELRHHDVAQDDVKELARPQALLGFPERFTTTMSCSGSSARRMALPIISSSSITNTRPRHAGAPGSGCGLLTPGMPAAPVNAGSRTRNSEPLPGWLSIRRWTSGGMPLLVSPISIQTLP
jgi:hypothetical protein